jgi:hypothetical protein
LRLTTFLLTALIGLTLAAGLLLAEALWKWGD